MPSRKKKGRIDMEKQYSLNPSKWAILSTACLASLIIPLNMSVINTALPVITAFYRTTLSNAEWVVLIYLLLVSSLLLTFGRLGDMYGHRSVFLLGVVIFTAASYLVSWSPTIGYLIFFRGLQAVGAGMILAVAQAIIARTFPPGERGKALGINTVFVSLGLAIGPSLGGFIIKYYSWQVIFLINIPIGIIIFLWAWRILPTYQGAKQRFDLIGSFSLFTSLLLFLLVISHGQTGGWTTLAITGSITVALGLFAFFLVWELRIDYPMIRLALFKNRYFSGANAAAVLSFITQYGVIFLLPFYLMDLLGLDSSQAGLLMVTFPLSMMLTSSVSGMLSDRMGSRMLSTTGMAFCALGVYVLSRLDTAGPLALILAGQALVGMGNGLFVVPNTNVIMSNVPKEQFGIASGMNATTRSIGQALGIAISGAVLSNRRLFYADQFQGAGMGGGMTEEMAYVLAQHDAFLVVSVFGIAGMILSFIYGSVRNSN